MFPASFRVGTITASSGGLKSFSGAPSVSNQSRFVRDFSNCKSTHILPKRAPFRYREFGIHSQTGVWFQAIFVGRDNILFCKGSSLLDEAAWRSEKAAVMQRWRNKVYCAYKTLMARGEL
jgi:hypothetical protein